MLSCFSHVRLFVTLQTVTHQSPLSMEFSRQEYCNGLPCPPPGDLPDPGIEPRSPALQVYSLPAEPQECPRILEWVAYPFSSGSSQLNPYRRISCISVQQQIIRSIYNSIKKKVKYLEINLIKEVKDLYTDGIHERN